MLNESKRRILRIGAAVSIAIAAGHYVQTSQVAPDPNAGQSAAANPEQPVNLTLLSSSSADASPMDKGNQDPATPEIILSAAQSGGAKFLKPETPQGTPVDPSKVDMMVTVAATNETPSKTSKVIELAQTAALSDTSPDRLAGIAPNAGTGDVPLSATSKLIKETTDQPLSAAKPLSPTPPDCKSTLDLLSDDAAMIGITLLSPCAAGQSFTIRHAGLSLPGKFSDKGAFFAFIPALEMDAKIEIALPDGEELSAEILVPEVLTIRRVAFQWQSPDRFGLRAIEKAGSTLNEDIVSAENPKTPIPGELPVGGYLSRYGDDTILGDIITEIYTFPADPTLVPELMAEAPVNEANCGREILGVTLHSANGLVESRDLFLSMPACTDLGGFLVLNNLIPDTMIAASN